MEGSPIRIGVHQFVRLFVTRFLATVVLVVMLTGGAVAGALEEAWAAYEHGDYATALRLWRPLAAQGNAFAQSNLGFMYDSGQGVQQDYGEAAKWYRLAAEQGNARAQSNLGSLYASGEGVPQDYVQAYMWFDLAASRFSASEAEEREDTLYNRNKAGALITPEQVAEAKKLAREWKPVKPGVP